MTLQNDKKVKVCSIYNSYKHQGYIVVKKEPEGSTSASRARFLQSLILLCRINTCE